MNDQDAQSRIKVYLETAKRMHLLSAKPAQRQTLLTSIFTELEMGSLEQQALIKHGQDQLALAQRLCEQGRQLEGMQHYQLARLLLPLDVSVLEFMLELYHQQGAHKSVRTIAKEILALQSENPRALAVLSDMDNDDQPYWKTLLKVLLIGYACLLLINWAVDNLLISSNSTEGASIPTENKTAPRK